MTRKRLLVLPDAARDLRQATTHYRNEADSPTALRFAEAVRDTLMAITGRPGIGSPRYAGPLKLPGLRSHPTRRFPYLVFYMERADRIEIWRVLHAQRDIPTYFGEVGSSS